MLHRIGRTADVTRGIASADVPTWSREMSDHYRHTGEYRAEDVRRVLGDPAEGVERTALSNRVSSGRAGHAMRRSDP